MKKIRKSLKILLIMLLGFITNTGLAYALNSQLTLSKTTVAPGGAIGVSIVVSEIPTTGLRSADYVLTYDASKIEYVSVESGDVVINNTGSAINISYNNMTDSALSAGKIITLNFKAKNEAADGNAVFSLSGSNYADGDATQVTGTTNGATLAIHKPSSACNLTSLSVTGMTLSPAFSASKIGYTLPETTAASVTINATADAGATIVGNGARTLEYGSNALGVVVTAEDGTTKTYTINIVKTDTRSKNNFLSSLGISEGTIDFKKDKYYYSIEVATEIEKATVSATAEDSKAKVKGTGVKTVAYGENKFNIIVTAENGDAKIYTIAVTRAAPTTDPNLIVPEEGKVLLSTLTINGINIELVANQYSYLFGINNEIQSLTIEYVALSKTAVAVIEGQEDLHTGINKVLITLTDEGNTTTYTILVNKTEKTGIVGSLGDLNKNTLKEKAIYNFKESDDKTIYISVLELLKEYKSTLVLNVVNQYNGLLYQVQLTNKITSKKDLNINLIKYDLKYLAYKTTLPESAKVKLYLGDNYLNIAQISIYTYQEKTKQYVLLADKVKVNNGYIDFTTNGEAVYVFTQDKLAVSKTKTKASSSNIFKYLSCFFGGAIAGVGGTLGVQFILKKKSKKTPKESVEVL